MRVPARLVIFLSIFSIFSTSAIGCGATKAQRRTTAAITIAAGAGLLVGGLVAANTEDDDDCPAEGGLCIDLVDENAIGGRVLMLTGGVLAFVGLVGLVAAPRPEAPPPPPGADIAACIEWRRALDAEKDPARRGAVHAIRPPHCARPAH